MNVGWSGMSKTKCLERAYEANSRASGPAGQCGYVSYSDSAGPQQRTDFCRCHVQADCGDPLDQPRGESWETFLTEEPKKSQMLVILACVAAVAAVLLIGLAVYLRRHRTKSEQAELGNQHAVGGEQSL